MCANFTRFSICLLCLLLSVPLHAAAQGESAQSAPTTQEVSGDLADIRFEGISNDTTRSLVRVRLVARPGTPVERINLEAERNRILGLGTFSSVRLSLEPGEEGPVLVVQAEENPPIAAVDIEGSSFPVERLKEFLAQSLIEADTTYNTFRAREGIEILQQVYQQNGYPGTVPVTLDVVPVEPGEEESADADADEPDQDAETPSATDEEIAQAEAVRLVYTLNESPPLDEVNFSGATVFSEERLRELFGPLVNGEDFDPRAYNAGVQAVADAYEEQGFRGSGVNPRTTVLENGTLNVEIQELSILSFDTTAVGIDADALSLERGDLYNYDALLDDIQRLASERSQDIRIETTVTENGGVRVALESGPPDSAGPIDAVEIEGNTVFSNEELRDVLRLGVNDTFTSAAAEDDFRRLAESYQNAGYLLVVPAPATDFTYPDGTNVFNYVDGTYVQRLREVKIAGYEVDLQDEDPRTNDDVITRYLPDVGTVYNQREVERGILAINRLNIVQLTQVAGRISHALVPTDQPDEVIVRFIASEQPARTIRPSAELSTEGGVSFGAEVGYIDSNLFGEAHRLSVTAGAQTSDVGFQLSGNVSYDIPWLYVDFLDFQEVPTELNVDLFSEVQNNQPLTNDGERRVCLDLGQACADDQKVLIGEYSQRDTGLRFGVARPVLQNTSVRLSGRFTSTRYTTEPFDEPCEIGEDGNLAVENPTNCRLDLDEDDPATEANRAFVADAKPQNGFSSFVGVSGAYDTRDNPEFPRSGYRFTASTGIGFGNDFQQEGEQRGYTYQPVEFGARTYLALANPSHVFAFRFNAGHQFSYGGDYPTSRFFIVGDTNNEATQLRGYTRDDINPSRTYAVGTAEYRYDFGLSTPVTQTIVGIVFTDVGYASGVVGENFAEPLLFSAGLGVQLNIGFGGALALPPLRFDYGFSPANPTGTFGFRLGFNF